MSWFLMPLTAMALTFGLQQQAGTTTDTTKKAADDTREQMTAADVLKAMQRKRPGQLIIAPDGKSLQDPDDQQAQLLPEGFPLINVDGVLEKREGWWMFTIGARDGMPISTMKMLPNSSLEPMTRTVEGLQHPVAFTVSGEVTEFEGENYIFAHLVAKKKSQPLNRTGAATQPGSSLPESMRPGKAVEPAAPPTTTPTDDDVDDVMAALEAQTPSFDPVSIVAVSPAATPSDSPESQPAIRAEGEPIISRPARVLPSGDWWTLVFEGDGNDVGDAPIKILPNRNLQRMTESIGETTGGVIFLVSGRTTVFESENYFLTRSVQRLVASGNLRK
ncbi:MAG: hypothetical protein ACYTHJ_13590 [Planctomycetota bacterium]|jgi:hypothetical protein